MKIRIAVSVFVAAHGLGYIIWFLAAWVPSVLGSDAQFDTGAFAKVFGIAAIAALAGFLTSAWGIWHGEEWWPTALVISLIAAIPTAWFVWNPVGDVSVMAELANAGLVATTLLPMGDRLLGAH